jgi:hypothetical protein
LNCGRRWGKTELGKDLVAEAALSGLHVGWFAPTYKILADAWRELVLTLKPYTARSNAAEHRIELVTGGALEMWSLVGGEDAGRSRAYARVIVDEAAMVPNLMQVWMDAIRPTLTDFRGDAWFMSTPKGRNDFWQLYQYGLDPLREDWMCWSMPTRTNPFIDPGEIAAAKGDMTEDKFMQEYLAEFLESGAIFRKVHEATTAKPQEYAQDGFASYPKHTYVCGVDWGKYEDFSVFAVIDTTINELVYLDRSNNTDYTMQIKRLEDLCKRFQIAEVIAESNAMAIAIELMRAANLPVREFVTTNQSKHNIIESLKLAIEQGKLKLLNDSVLLSELQAFEATKLPGGGLRYAAPPGMHDDTVMALAIAWSAVESIAAPIRIEKYTPVRVIRKRQGSR